MKKTLLALSLAASSLTAEKTYQMEQSADCCCEPEYDCCCSCGTPPARPCVDCECYTPQYYNLQCAFGVFVYADFLYWYGKDTGLTLGQTLDLSLAQINGGEIAVLSQTKTTYFRESWEPAFRVGIGLNSCCDGWDLDLSWTYFKTCRTEKFPAKDNTFYINSWMNPGSGLSVAEEISVPNIDSFIPVNTSTQGKYRQRLNYIDLELGRKYWLSKCMTYRPFIGIRGAWDRSKLDITGVIPPDGLINDDPRFDETIIKTRSWGAGILLGVEPDWYLGCGFSIYGTFDAALLWGDFEIRRTETTLPSGSSFVVPDYKEDFSTMLPIIDLGIGVKWERAFCCNRYLMALQVGWEQHVWFDHNHRPLYGDIQGVLMGSTPVPGTIGIFSNNDAKSQYGNFVFGGLVVRARFDF